MQPELKFHSEAEQKKFYAIGEMVITLTEVYNQPVPTERVLLVWWEALKAIDLTALRRAFNIHVVNPDAGQFMPKPADIVKMLVGTTTDKAMLAWSKTDKGVRLVGPWDSVAFDDANIHRVIDRMGGWISLCSKGDSDWPFLQKEFITSYRAFIINPPSTPYPPVLFGLYELNNMRMGYAKRPPRLLGDPEKARQVMLGGTGSVSAGIPLAGFLDTLEVTATAPALMVLAATGQSIDAESPPWLPDNTPIPFP